MPSFWKRAASFGMITDPTRRILVSVAYPGRRVPLFFPRLPGDSREIFAGTS
ncbi:hypothetical protein [Mobiluncus mulieris]|uniref:hypothetical protein n=1 Tax=Mobiluncus mulieris TaxID=2052 RepID=UPI00019F85EF|nr:hypothetical protein [Mobiluncus mulieris]EEJ54459.1 hypothetical protein HMPREF0577_0576 [Mobiluncus mulieris ATCC 35243]